MVFIDKHNGGDKVYYSSLNLFLPFFFSVEHPLLFNLQPPLGREGRWLNVGESHFWVFLAAKGYLESMV